MTKQWIKPIVLMVTGGRDYNDAGVITNALSARIEHWATRYSNKRVFVVIGGAKTGVDEIIRQFCMKAGIAHAVIPAEWNNEEFGKSAGVRRNQQMLDWFTPEEILVYPGGKGTADMLERARELRVMQVAAKCPPVPVAVLRVGEDGMIAEDAPRKADFSDVEDLI